MKIFKSIPCCLAWFGLLLVTGGLPGAAADRQAILVCAAKSAPPEIQQLADSLAAEAKTALPLQAMLQSHCATGVQRKTSEEVLANQDLAACNHLVVIGLPSSDPLMKKIWEHYITMDEKERTAYAQGWGYLKGDLGYIEAYRNPFLHNQRIKEAPFETAVVKITGNSLAGVQAAAKSFRGGLLNGLVPAGPCQRPKTTILDLDPLAAPPALRLPSSLPPAQGFAGAALAGWSQCPANEYRAYLDLGQPEPKHVWRGKYLVDGAMKQAGITGWLQGLHRMSFGNAVTIAEFAMPSAAASAAAAIGKSDKAWRQIPNVAGTPAWEADQPTDEALKPTGGKIIVLARGRFLVISSLPAPVLAEMLPRCTLPN